MPPSLWAHRPAGRIVTRAIRHGRGEVKREKIQRMQSKLEEEQDWGLTG